MVPLSLGVKAVSAVDSACGGGGGCARDLNLPVNFLEGCVAGGGKGGRLLTSSSSIAEEETPSEQAVVESLEFLQWFWRSFPFLGCS